MNSNAASQIDAMLTEPSEGLVSLFNELDGDVAVLGANGKLGPSLVGLAQAAIERANSATRIYAVSRFGSEAAVDRFRAMGAEPITADITDDDELAALPDAANIIFLVGTKFGSSTNSSHTWEVNSYLPGRVARRFKGSRIVALSTGNVYPFTEPGSGGATEETDAAPVGEYAMSALGRERMFEAAAMRDGTPTALIRLNYAAELRGGVLVDIAKSILAGEPVDLTVGSVNVVWQGYANEVILRSLALASSPAVTLNLAGPETLSVRSLALQFGRLFGRDVEFVGTPAPTSLLSNGGRGYALFGYPRVSVEQLVAATAEWLMNGGETNNKPTKFQHRDGRF